jgi:hypothetical protein
LLAGGELQANDSLSSVKALNAVKISAVSFDDASDGFVELESAVLAGGPDTVLTPATPMSAGTIPVKIPKDSQDFRS